MIKLVAFDWNGTLLSDALACLESVNEVLALFNIKSASIEDFREHFDVPVSKSYLGLGVSEAQLENKAEEVVKTFHAEKLSLLNAFLKARKIQETLISGYLADIAKQEAINIVRSKPEYDYLLAPLINTAGLIGYEGFRHAFGFASVELNASFAAYLENKFREFQTLIHVQMAA